MRILHFSDLHLGVSEYGTINPKTGLPTRTEDIMKILKSIVDRALFGDIDLVVFTGDAFDSAKPPPAVFNFFADQMARLSAAEIPTVIVVGNHDLAATTNSSFLESLGAMLKNVTIIKRFGLYEVCLHGGKKVQVVGAPSIPRSLIVGARQESVEESVEIITERACRKIGELKDKIKGLAIFAGHLTVDEISSEIDYKGSGLEVKVPFDVLFDRRFAYVALGHFHRYRDLSNGLTPPVVYAGSVDRLTFSDKDSDKGYVVVDIDEEKGIVEGMEFVRTPAREMVEIEVKLWEGGYLSALEKVRRQPVRGRIVKLKVCGARGLDPFVRDAKEILSRAGAYFVAVEVNALTPKAHSSFDSSLASKLLSDPMLAFEEYLRSLCSKNREVSAMREKLLAVGREIIAEACGEGKE